MSINDFINKIKVKLDIDMFTIMCLFIIILVGFSSFGLGKLSVKQNKVKEEGISIISNKDLLANSNEIELNIKQENNDSSSEKKYVASKNGKLYYTIGCSGAKRIAEKNAIWFASSNEAEKSGYQFSSSCK